MNIAILSRSGTLYSTSSLAKAALKRGHHVRIVDHTYCDLFITKNTFEVFYFDKPVRNIDAVIPRIGASVTQYGAAIIRQFEMQNVYSVLSSRALLTSRDKLVTLQVLSAQGIDVPRTLLASHAQSLAFLYSKLGSKQAVVKLLMSTQGMGVLLAEDRPSAMSISEALIRVGKSFVVQEFIKESGGRDIRAFVVGDKVVAAMERVAVKGEFRSNIHLGASSNSIELTEQERNIALRCTKILGLKVAGVDILRSNRGPLVLEVNASPGLEGIETTTGVDVAGAIVDYIVEKVMEEKALSKD